ncbi:MAG: adenosine kinase, partial [Bacteroides sp.]|nr:adenosine kinase [Bacteroides sp.]
MEKIIGMGNALVDVLIKLKDDSTLTELELSKGSMTLIDDNKLNAINELLKEVKPARVAGGSAGNMIRALVELGGQGGFIGKIADDEFGRYFNDSMTSRGVETYMLFSNTQPSGVASTFISTDGERTFATHLGAAAEQKADELKQEMFEGYHYLFIEGYLVQDHE